MWLKLNARKFWAAAIFICALEAFAVGFLHYWQRRSSRAAICLARIRSNANRLNALEWKAIALGKLEPDVMEEVIEQRALIGENMAKLSFLAGGCLPIRSLGRVYGAYIKAVDKEFNHLRMGELPQAKWHDERRVDPAFKKLKNILQENATVCEAYAERFNRWDTWGTYLVLSAATVILLLLLKKYVTAQEAAIKAAADRQLLEVCKRTEAEIRQLNDNLELRVKQRTVQLYDANERLKQEITERRRLEILLQQVSEQEKQRLGQDLHDGLGQLLTGIAMRSKALENRLRSQALPEAEDLSQVLRLVAEALRTTRNLAWLLYPAELERNGLVKAIHALAVKLQHQFGVPCVFKDGLAGPMKDTVQATHIYRIAQEAVTNALRHGNARQVVIQLSQHQEEAVLTVENDGPVIQPTTTMFSGMGCRIMKYRASMIGGALQITPLPTGGCRVACTYRPAM
jgi:signal transduction histidine kinase